MSTAPARSEPLTASGMPVWLESFHNLAPRLSTPGLRALARALDEDDPTLIQNDVAVDAEGDAVSGRQAVAACAIAWTAWKGDGLRTVGELNCFFSLLLDEVLGPDPCHFVSFWDRTDRAEAVAALLPVVREILAAREES